MRQRGNDNLKANNQSRYGETRGCNSLSLIGKMQDELWSGETSGEYVEEPRR